jgi:hypothetical protein
LKPVQHSDTHQRDHEEESVCKEGIGTTYRKE